MTDALRVRRVALYRQLLSENAPEPGSVCVFSPSPSSKSPSIAVTDGYDSGSAASWMKSSVLEAP